MVDGINGRWIRDVRGLERGWGGRRERGKRLEEIMGRMSRVNDCNGNRIREVANGLALLSTSTFNNNDGQMLGHNWQLSPCTPGSAELNAEYTRGRAMEN